MKVAVVTGASSGIGLYTVLELAKQGYQVIALMREQSKTEALNHHLELNTLKEQVEQIKLNMENVQDVQHTIDNIVSKYNVIDVLVNNAGYAQGGLVELVDEQAWIEQFQANVWITINMCKAVAPIMRQQRAGKIINMGSVSGKIGLPAFAPYAMSKFAVAGFSEALRLELISYNVYVSLIEAGSYQTNIWSKGFSSLPANDIADYNSIYRRMVYLTEKSGKTKRHPRLVAQLIAKVVKKKRPTFRIIPTIDIKLIVFLKSTLPWILFERVLLSYVLKFKRQS